MIENTDMSFYYTWLYCTLQVLCFLQIEDLWQPGVQQILSVSFVQQHVLTSSLLHILIKVCTIFLDIMVLHTTVYCKHNFYYALVVRKFM